jgi:hypothetical protein
MKRVFLLPAVALSALATTAWAKPAPGAPATDTAKAPEPTDSLAREQLSDAAAKALSLYTVGDDVFAFSLTRAEDGTLVAQHYSHRSHSSHSSHSSHRSHYSSRW